MVTGAPKLRPVHFSVRHLVWVDCVIGGKRCFESSRICCQIPYDAEGSVLIQVGSGRVVLDVPDASRMELRSKLVVGGQCAVDHVLDHHLGINVTVVTSAYRREADDLRIWNGFRDKGGLQEAMRRASDDGTCIAIGVSREAGPWSGVEVGHKKVCVDRREVAELSAQDGLRARGLWRARHHHVGAPREQRRLYPFLPQVCIRSQRMDGDRPRPIGMMVAGGDGRHKRF